MPADHSITIGVLALQGAFAKHMEMIRSVGVLAKEVRRPEDLSDCDGLIIPGGESTTMFKNITFIKLEGALKRFAEQKPVFGTCAGLIIMSKRILNDTRQPFGILDVEVERNAFGRQAESFVCSLDMQAGGKVVRVPGIFIRAPRIKAIGSEVKVLASYQGEPVLIMQGRHMGAAFHPELTENIEVHKLFVEICEGERVCGRAPKNAEAQRRGDTEETQLSL